MDEDICHTNDVKILLNLSEIMRNVSVIPYLAYHVYIWKYDCDLWGAFTHMSNDVDIKKNLSFAKY